MDFLTFIEEKKEKKIEIKKTQRHKIFAIFWRKFIEKYLCCAKMLWSFHHFKLINCNVVLPGQMKLHFRMPTMFYTPQWHLIRSKIDVAIATDNSDKSFPWSANNFNFNMTNLIFACQVFRSHRTRMPIWTTFRRDIAYELQCRRHTVRCEFDVLLFIGQYFYFFYFLNHSKLYYVLEIHIYAYCELCAKWRFNFVLSGQTRMKCQMFGTKKEKKRKTDYRVEMMNVSVSEWKSKL